LRAPSGAAVGVGGAGEGGHTHTGGGHRAQHQHHLPVPPRPHREHRPTSPPHGRITTTELREELMLTNGHINQARTMLQRDMEWVSARIRSKNSRARVLSIKLGIEKLVGVYQTKELRSLNSSFRKWDTFTQYRASEASVRRYLQLR
jgi:hypothetical protein